MKKTGLADSPLFIKIKPKDETIPRNHITMEESNHDTMVETIRDAILEIGKEAATYRLTLGEKKKLAEIMYSFRIKNIRITENEIVRIALNALFYDYTKSKSRCILLSTLQQKKRISK